MITAITTEDLLWDAAFETDNVNTLLEQNEDEEQEDDKQFNRAQD